MRYLIDADICLDYLADRYSTVVKRFQQCVPTEVAVSSISAAELRYRAEKSATAESPTQRTLDIFFADVLVLDFDSAAALTYGKTRAALDRSGLQIPDDRLLVACHAIAKGLILVSGQRRRLASIPNLVLENWRQG